MKKRKLNNKELSELVERNQRLRACGNADHLSDENGNFITEFPFGDGEISIGALEDLCQFVYYKNNTTNAEKLQQILSLENMIQEHLGELTYIPTWSTELKDEINKNKNKK